MTIAQSARIHPTAVIAPEADLGDDVQVGPHVVLEGKVRIGAGCVLRPGAHLDRPADNGLSQHRLQRRPSSANGRSTSITPTSRRAW